MLIGITAGCTSPPERVNQWDQIEIPTPTEVRPVPLPELPQITPVETPDGTLYVVTPDGIVSLTAYKAASEGNYEILEHTLAEQQALILASEGLVKAGKLEFTLSEMRAQALEEERRAAFWERWTNRVLIIGLAVAVAL